jgi:hypothetical protein
MLSKISNMKKIKFKHIITININESNSHSNRKVLRLKKTRKIYSMLLRRDKTKIRVNLKIKKGGNHRVSKEESNDYSSTDGRYDRIHKARNSLS